MFHFGSQRPQISKCLTAPATTPVLSRATAPSASSPTTPYSPPHGRDAWETRLQPEVQRTLIALVREDAGKLLTALQQPAGDGSVRKQVGSVEELKQLYKQIFEAALEISTIYVREQSKNGKEGAEADIYGCCVAGLKVAQNLDDEFKKFLRRVA